MAEEEVIDGGEGENMDIAEEAAPVDPEQGPGKVWKLLKPSHFDALDACGSISDKITYVLKH